MLQPAILKGEMNMNRIDMKFEELKNNNRKALITFITAGDPDLETTARLVEEMETCGADIIELGIPYSDPVAEGPVIQDANKRAMENGIRISDVMNSVMEIRKKVNVPLLYLLYYNCILQYGLERFFKDCAAVGIDGVIVPDLPYEESGEISDVCSKYDVYSIRLVTPTSRERIEKIASDAKGFLYCVSSMGVTGIRKDFSTNFEEFFSYVNKASSVPKAIGFGISTPEHIKNLKKYADGLIVGSAIVKQVGLAKDKNDAVIKVGKLVKELKAALR
jgi:tryptophan synthase alpha chain